MSYWQPPPISVFDPVAQPLTWEWRNGQRMPIGPDASPNIWKGYGIPLLKVGKGPGATNESNRAMASDADRLKFYQLMIDNRAPEDPPSGGLAGDTFNPVTGEISINYFDGADPNHPWRKKITFSPYGKGGVSTTITLWNPANQRWEPEGFDLEKGFLDALPDIIKVFGAATTALVGLVTANPIIAAAWNQVFQSASAPVYGGPPPSLTDFAQQAAGFLGSAPGFGAAMADLSKNKLFKQSVFGNIGKITSDEISKFGTEVTSYLDKLRKTAEDFADAFPKIDLGAASKGIIPPDVQHAADNAAKGLTSFDLGSYKLAVDTFLHGMPDDAIRAIRKTADDKATFDTTYATAIATAKSDRDAEIARNAANAAYWAAHPEAIQNIGHGQASQILLQDTARSALGKTVRQLQTRYGIH